MPPRRAPLPREVAEDQAPPMQQEEGVIHAEFRTTFTLLAQVLANKANREFSIPPQTPTSTTKAWDIMRMNPLEYHGSKVDEDPIEFLNEAYRIVASMGVPSKE